MSDKVTVVSKRSYGNRIKGSFASVAFWILLIIWWIFLLWRNEQRFVQQKKGLNEAGRVVTDASLSTINNDLNGDLVYLYWQVEPSDELLIDNDFWVKTDDLKLHRSVWMYQWQEDIQTERKDKLWWSEEITTTYEYKKDWSDRQIDSQDFYEKSGHTNPTTRDFDEKNWEKETLSLGEYVLTDVFTRQLAKENALSLKDQTIVAPEWYQQIVEEQQTTTGENVIATWDNATGNVIAENVVTGNNAVMFSVLGDSIYIGKDRNNPTVGDMKITYFTVKPTDVSVIWKQDGNELTSYKTSEGTSIALLRTGEVPREEIFQSAHTFNKNVAWMLRGVWLLLMYFWFMLLFSFVITLAKVVPFISKIISVGAWILSAILTLLLGWLVIAIAWLAVRPLTWILVFVVAVLCAVVLFFLKKRQAK